MFNNFKKSIVFILILFQIHILLGTPDFNFNILRRVRNSSFPLLTAEELVAAVEEWLGPTWIPEPNPWLLTGVIKTLRGHALEENGTFKIYKKGTEGSIFYKHILIKLLDDYFVSSGQYTSPHIAPPLAPFETENEKGYYSIYAKGSECFEWGEGGISKNEWNTFSYLMDLAGFNMSYDLVDDDNAAHNVIVAGPTSWTRIDLDSRSCPYSVFGKTAQFLEEHAKALQTVLGDDKYRLLELAYKIFDSRSDTATESEMTEFEVLFARYQHEILRNYFPGI
ncbi:MAG: hypothetical protein P9M06_02945 [Candidatus Saelkia tenebricola]|nr:hypothetical protein [Candidatus Saelkia tenebricola]